MRIRVLVRRSSAVLLALAALALSACDAGAPTTRPVLTAADLPALAPDAEDVSALLHVDAVEARDNDALTQSLEALDPGDQAALETYGRGYTAGDPNSAPPWSAAGVLLALARTPDDASRIADALTAAPAWSDTGFPGPGTGAARSRHIDAEDGFSGDLMLLQTDRLLVQISVIGSEDEARGEAVEALARDVLARVAALDD